MEIYMCYKCGRKLTIEQLAFLTRKIKLSENEKYRKSEILYRICPYCNEPTTYVRSFLEDKDLVRPPRADVESKVRMLMELLPKAGMKPDVEFISRWIRNHYVLQKLLIIDEEYVQKIVKEVVKNAGREEDRPKEIA